MKCPWCNNKECYGNCPEAGYRARIEEAATIWQRQQQVRPKEEKSSSSGTTYQKNIQNQGASQEKTKSKTIGSHNLPKVFYNKNCSYCGFATNYLKLGALRPCNEKCGKKQQLLQKIEMEERQRRQEFEERRRQEELEQRRDEEEYRRREAIRREEARREYEARIQQQKIQGQIETKRTELTQLINSAKEKLTSKSIFATKRKEKEKNYQSSLKVLLMDSQFQDEEQKEQVKQHLSKKLTKGEILSLIDKKGEISQLERQLQLFLSKCDKQKFQIEIPPK